jgi:hypothetical protein
MALLADTVGRWAVAAQVAVLSDATASKSDAVQESNLEGKGHPCWSWNHSFVAFSPVCVLLSGKSRQHILMMADAVILP